LTNSESANRPTVYLAGPVMSMDDGGAGWREDVEAYCGEALETRNPLSKYNIPVDDIEIAADASHGGDAVVSVSEIVENDKHLLAESDAVLVGYSQVHSIGTPMEVMWAYEREMPIVVWSRDDTPPGEMSPWYRYHADYMTPTLPIALHTLEQLATEGDDE